MHDYAAVVPIVVGCFLTTWGGGLHDTWSRAYVTGCCFAMANALLRAARLVTADFSMNKHMDLVLERIEKTE